MLRIYIYKLYHRKHRHRVISTEIDRLTAVKGEMQQRSKAYDSLKGSSNISNLKKQL